MDKSCTRGSCTRWTHGFCIRGWSWLTTVLRRRRLCYETRRLGQAHAQPQHLPPPHPHPQPYQHPGHPGASAPPGYAPGRKPSSIQVVCRCVSFVARRPAVSSRSSSSSRSTWIPLSTRSQSPKSRNSAKPQVLCLTVNLTGEPAPYHAPPGAPQSASPCFATADVV